jgi:hypothetical protein
MAGGVGSGAASGAATTASPSTPGVLVTFPMVVLVAAGASGRLFGSVAVASESKETTAALGLRARPVVRFFFYAYGGTAASSADLFIRELN